MHNFIGYQNILKKHNKTRTDAQKLLMPIYKLKYYLTVTKQKGRPAKESKGCIPNRPTKTFQKNITKHYLQYYLFVLMQLMMLHYSYFNTRKDRHTTQKNITALSASALQNYVTCQTEVKTSALLFDFMKKNIT